MSWKEGFAKITKLPHSEQAKWWLNGFWDSGAKEKAEEIWKITHTFIELDVGFPILYGGKMREYKESADLDEMKSHVILEKLGETMTVKELRARLNKLDLDNNKRMAISEYLLDKYKKTPEELVKAPQGNIDPKKLKEAEEKLAAAGAALDKAAADADSAAAALEAAKAAAADAAEKLAAATAAAEAAAAALQAAQAAAKAAADALAAAKKSAAAAAAAKVQADKDAEAAAVAKAKADKEAAAAADALKVQQAAQAVVQAAEDELKAAIHELEKQEADYNGKIAALQAQVDDASLSAMKKSKASNELAQLKSEDPMPLRKAKITQGAALKKVEKERKNMEAATAVLAEKKAAADASAAAATKAKNEADASAAEAAKRKKAADDDEAASAAAKANADAKEAASAAAKADADAKAAASAAAKKEADAKEAASAAAKKQAEQAKEAAAAAVKVAEANLAELQKGGSGTPNGVLWWMQKTLIEKKKFMK